MVSLVLKSSFAHRGIFRDKIREWVAAELNAAVEDKPETVYESKNGDVRSFKSEDSVIISNYVKHLFRSYLYLDSNRTLCISPPPRHDCTSLICFHLGSQGGERPQLPAPPAGSCSSIQHARFPEGAPSLSHHRRVQEDEPIRRHQQLDALDRRDSPLTRRLRWDDRKYPRLIFFLSTHSLMDRFVSATRSGKPASSPKSSSPTTTITTYSTTSANESTPTFWTFATRKRSGLGSGSG